MGAVLKRVQKRYGAVDSPLSTTGEGQWADLSGLLLPCSEEERLLEEIKQGCIDSVTDVLAVFNEIHAHYRDYQWAWTYRMICDYYHLETITPDDVTRIHTDYVQARRAWIAEIRKDAEKEFAMGDVEPQVLENFLQQLTHESDYEDA